MLPLIDISFANALCVGLAAYLLGSIPFGMVLARLMGLGNLRDIGSGNIGATNVLRTGSKGAAFLTLLFDAGKGGVAVLIAHAYGGQDAAQLAGLCALLGHCFPIWLKFKGGKGVATFLGIILSLSFLTGLGACIAWLIGAFSTRMSSVGGLAASASTPVLFWAFGQPQAVMLGIILALLVWWRHAGNIKRILAGAEPRIGQK